jgi:hypothetical protein
MKAIAYFVPMLALACTACAPTPPPTTKVVVRGNTFCKTMKRIHPDPPAGKIKWSPTGNPETVAAVRRQNRAVDQKC